MTISFEREYSRPRRSYDRKPDRLRSVVATIPIIAAAGLAASACLDRTVPLAPECTATIGIELATEEIHVGDTFTATATHRGDECLSNLMWSAEGVISLRAAEGQSATFRADESGSGRIRVINDKGNLGVLDVAVEDSEEGGAIRGR